MANRELAALSLSAAGPSVNGGDLENSSSASALIVVDQTANSGGTAVYTVEGKDPLSGKYYTVIASAAQTGVTTFVMRVGQGLTAAANLVVLDVMPKTFRVTYTRGTSAVTTATVGVTLVG